MIDKRGVYLSFDWFASYEVHMIRIDWLRRYHPRKLSFKEKKWTLFISFKTNLWLMLGSNYFSVGKLLSKHFSCALHCLHSLSLLVLFLSVIVVVLFIFKLKSNIIFQSDNFGLWSLSVCITYEFVVIRRKVVLVAVVLYLEKQKKG